MIDSGQKNIKSSVPVPVRVVPVDSSRPILPPVDMQTPPPTPTTPKAVLSAATNQAKKFKAQTFSPAKKRKVMWMMVGGVMVMVVAGWLTVFPSQFKGGENRFFSDLANIVQNWKPATSALSASEQEIQSLSQQIFPQFQPQQ